eukprot:CAMPEP_0197827908 /NCGR_PEP_ID=MMETSP1437-20131217/4583_1 /TAXON_ID=49252 ORGANISM="Eucampia antarctica, Strain CCMP1452" /NCGR_SAMPLE_ID=MMETSP1437 /ASSEMBLY_ACC=CAM_ASM_001096 /LENGTH=84 /DNA_ID=CAMNT_0043428927 /DNA_START=603 /DNA_END=857 /DNA_ORIENTATION=+
MEQDSINEKKKICRIERSRGKKEVCRGGNIKPIKSVSKYKIGDRVRALNVEGTLVKEMNKYVDIKDNDGKVYRKHKRNLVCVVD